MRARAPLSPGPRGGQKGVTLVEAIISLVIVATAIIPAMTALGGASDNVLRTKNRRIMRYLAQMVLADIEIGKISPDEEEEHWEEGQTMSFEGYGSRDDPDEYADYEVLVEVFRETPIIGGGEELEDQGFETTEEGQLLGRPVSNDFLAGGEEELPEGQMKRVVIIAIRLVGEDVADDRTLRLMTYLPMPGEEEQQVGGPEGLGGAGAAPAEPGAAGASRSATTTTGSDRGR